jgi:uroporphyrinogen-III synthase
LRVLITRPVLAARALARTLEARGHAVWIEPLLTIEPLTAALRLNGVQAVALTSAQALPALARLWEREPAAAGLRVFAVGAATAATARRAGGTRVEAADGDASSLARRIVTSCLPDDGAILHLCGTEVRAGLAEPLIQAGFRLIRQPVYSARAARRLSAPTCAALREGIDAVLLYSPRTATILAKLVRELGLERALERTDACCLSPAVADGCRGLGWRQVRIAARPDQAALVELLEAMDRRC